MEGSQTQTLTLNRTEIAGVSVSVMDDSEHFAAADGRVYHHTDEAMRNRVGTHNGDGTFRTDLAEGMGGLSLDPAAQLAAVRAQQAATHAAAQQGGAQGGAQQGGGGAAAAVRDDEAEESSDEDGAAKWSAEAEDALARQDDGWPVELTFVFCFVIENPSCMTGSTTAPTTLFTQRTPRFPLQ